MRNGSRHFGCGVLVAANVVLVVLLLFMAAGAGMLFPANCGVDVSIEECARVHENASRPVFALLSLIVAMNLAAAVSWRARRER